jgi:hypothetical protein
LLSIVPSSVADCCFVGSPGAFWSFSPICFAVEMETLEDEEPDVAVAAFSAATGLAVEGSLRTEIEVASSSAAMGLAVEGSLCSDTRDYH